jgi:hypothetical protein
MIGVNGCVVEMARQHTPCRPSSVDSDQLLAASAGERRIFRHIICACVILL